MKKGFFYNKGLSLVEAIIGTAVISLTLLGSITVYNYFIKAWPNNLENIQSSYLLAEGTEIVYYFRDSGWTPNIAGISLDTKEYFEWDGNNWATSTTNIFIDNLFERSFVLSNVYRDSNSNIANSGTLDPKSRKATIYTAWNSGGGTTTKSISIYISNIFGN